jgi:CheY-like chemotaxis protein
LQPKILLVEDVPYEWKTIIRDIGHRALVIHTDQASIAKEYVESDPDIEVIIMDAILEDGSTYDLVEELRSAGCNIPIVTSSSEGRCNERLMRSGCSHLSDKDNSWRVALEILGIDPDS